MTPIFDWARDFSIAFGLGCFAMLVLFATRKDR